MKENINSEKKINFKKKLIIFIKFFFVCIFPIFIIMFPILKYFHIINPNKIQGINFLIVSFLSAICFFVLFLILFFVDILICISGFYLW